MRHMILVLALAFSLGFAGRALAHAELESSEPAADAVLTSPPSEVRLVFTEEIIEGTSALVSDASGKRVDHQDGAIDLTDLDHKTFVLTLPANLPDGRYTVEYTAKADDGHEEEGAFSFTVRRAVQAQPTPTRAPATATSVPTRISAPTATPAPAGNAPATLPSTGGESGPLLWIGLGAIATALIGGVIRRRTRR